MGSFDQLSLSNFASIPGVNTKAKRHAKLSGGVGGDLRRGMGKISMDTVYRPVTEKFNQGGSLLNRARLWQELNPVEVSLIIGVKGLTVAGFGRKDSCEQATGLKR